MFEISGIQLTEAAILRVVTIIKAKNTGPLLGSFCL